MISKVLFATDLGAYTTHGLLHVESLARQFDAKVHVIHAVPPIGEFAAAVMRSHCSDQVKQEVLQAPHIKGLLEALREQIFESLMRDPSNKSEFLARIQDIVVLPGHPAAVILAEAERLQVDLIIVGSHSSDAIDCRLLGSVATKVLQLARTPVFMIPMANPAMFDSPSAAIMHHR